MKESKCPNCGAPLGANFNKETTTCPYCSSVFVNKENSVTESKSEEKTEEFKPILNLDFNKPQRTNEIPQKPKVKFNFLIFVILLFACWPLAIFYAIIAK